MAERPALAKESSRISDKYAFCMVYKKDFDINAGICQLQNHA